MNHVNLISNKKQVLVEQGLGKYCDPDFVRYTSREMQEALDMTPEEMDMAAHQLLQQERTNQGLVVSGNRGGSANQPLTMAFQNSTLDLATNSAITDIRNNPKL